MHRRRQETVAGPELQGAGHGSILDTFAGRANRTSLGADEQTHKEDGSRTTG